MKNTLLLLLLILSGCILNADQERSLLEAQHTYMESYNDGDVIRHVGMTHPDVVGHYKQQGNSAFNAKFDLTKELHLQDGSIRKSVKKDNKLQILIEFKLVHIDDYTLSAEKLNVIAMSEDQGETWLFADKDDYMNDAIIPKNNRLIDPE